MKIEKIKKAGIKYQITLDNGDVINTFSDVILNNDLLFSKDIDSKLLEKINNDTNYYDVYNRVLRMIGRRLRSEFEIRNYLKKEDIASSDSIKIIENLKKIGLIDDYQFAKAYTNDKMNLSLDGPYKIARYLESNKIDSKIICEMVESYPEDLIDSHIKKIILKKIKTNKKYTGYILKQKIITYLINLGYRKEDINKHLDLLEFDNDVMENEMEKLYKKLSLKYSSDEFYIKFKTKLYSKGFSNEQIEAFIRKKE